MRRTSDPAWTKATAYINTRLLQEAFYEAYTHIRTHTNAYLPPTRYMLAAIVYKFSDASMSSENVQRYLQQSQNRISLTDQGLRRRIHNWVPLAFVFLQQSVVLSSFHA